jgi:hypothetical protein
VGHIRDVNEHTEHPLWRRVARTILPGAVRHRLGTWYGELGIAHLPDRIYLVRELIPAVGRCADKVLLIGCRPYTKHYPGLFGMHGAECWTIDIDPSTARWGAPGRHVTGAIQDSQVHLPASWFDAIVLNGVFGFGLNSVWDQDTALRACRLLLKSHGWLVLGWNADRCVDPSELPALGRYFRASSFPGLHLRRTFAKSTHVFAIFTAVEVE